MNYIIPFQYNKKFSKNINLQIIRDEKLNQSEKIFLIYLVENLNISYLKKNKPYCHFTKNHLCKNLHVCKKTIENIFRKLKDEEYIEIKLINNNKNKFYLMGRKFYDPKIEK